MDRGPTLDAQGGTIVGTCWSNRPRDGVLGSCPPLRIVDMSNVAPPAGVADVVDSVVLPTIAGVAPRLILLKWSLLMLPLWPMLFPANPVGTRSLTDQDGTLSPTDLAGILFPAVPAGIPFPADRAGILLPADLAEPVTVGVLGWDSHLLRW